MTSSNLYCYFALVLAISVNYLIREADSTQLNDRKCLCRVPCGHPYVPIAIPTSTATPTTKEARTSTTTPATIEPTTVTTTPATIEPTTVTTTPATIEPTTVTTTPATIEPTTMTTTSTTKEARTSTTTPATIEPTTMTTTPTTIEATTPITTEPTTTCQDRSPIIFLIRKDIAIRENFARPWDDYVAGFGEITGEFWAGLEFMHLITNAHNRANVTIRMETFEGELLYAEYSVFQVGGLDTSYTLIVSGYIGTAGDALSYHSGRLFSTYDRNDEYPCSEEFGNGAGWWYHSCFTALLTNADGSKIYWNELVLKSVVMMFIPIIGC